MMSEAMASSLSPLLGRRIHIAGSAARTDTPDTVRYAQELVTALVDKLVALGATFVVPIDREPRMVDDDPGSAALTFDWTVLAAAWAARGSRPHPNRLHEPFIYAVSHRKALDSQIPPDRKALWSEVLHHSDIVRLTNLGEWNVGAMRREAQARVGGVLIALGGDEGVLHLANLYREAGKPVVPINVPIRNQARGAALLWTQAEREPARFFRAVGHDPSALLEAASCVRCPPVDESALAVIRLLESLAPPTAFCVRLTNPECPDFSDVDCYFQRVVEPVIREAGYAPLTIDASRAEYAFLNVEIFSRLHRSELVLGDFTASRPNCFIELGYALARQIPTVMMAKVGTACPFDVKAVPTLFWNLDDSEDALRDELRQYWIAALKRAAVVPSDPLG